MKVIVHRGTHEIGGSCIEVSSGSSRIVLDVGLPLNVDPEMLRSPDGLMRYRPKVEGLFKDAAEQPSVDAVLLTHCHPDHSTFCDSVHPAIPIYMSKGTDTIMAALGTFLGRKRSHTNIVTVKTRPRTTYRIGGFQVVPHLVDHSAPDSVAFVIQAEGKTLVYTGDFRAHGRKAKMFEAFIRACPRQPEVLLMEGTMVGSHRANRVAQSEEDIERQLVGLIRKNRNRPLLANFSPTNFDRLITFLRACMTTKTELVIDLFTAYLYEEMRRLGLNIPDVRGKPIRVLYFKGHADKLADAGKRSFFLKLKPAKVDFHELNSSVRRIVLFRPNHLGTFERNGVRFKDTTLINSQYEGTYPGQEKITKRFHAYLSANQIEKVQLHTSGHAFEKDLLRFAKTVQPKMLVPIHTCHPEEYPNIFPGLPVRRLADGETLEI